MYDEFDEADFGYDGLDYDFSMDEGADFERPDWEDDVDEIQENEDFAHDNIIEDQHLDGMYEE